MSIQKAQLRMSARTLRDGMSQEERDTASAAICKNIFASECFAHCDTVLCYAPIGSEADILSVAKAALASSKTVGFPICRDEQMDFYAVSALTELCRKDRWGIRIPAADESCRITPNEKTLMLMPGLLFDRCGNRIGYGKGYYDRYLHRALRSPITVGVTYAALLSSDAIPAEEQDIPAMYLVTEKELIRI